MEPGQIEKFIGLTFVVMAIATLLFTLQFFMNITLPSIVLIAVFVLLFLLALITGIVVLKGSGEE